MALVEWYLNPYGRNGFNSQDYIKFQLTPRLFMAVEVFLVLRFHSLYRKHSRKIWIGQTTFS